MGRPREFDEEKVLDQALDAFWRRGYEATSVADLMEATGLAKGSLYKAFGDKKSLFLVALRRYLDQGYVKARAILFDAESAEAGVGAWLEHVVRMATCPKARGCFAVNCTVETAPHDPEVQAVLVKHAARLERLFEDVLARGVERGELRPDLDPPTAARFITTIVNGLQVSGKGGLSYEDAQAQLALAMFALR